MCFRALVEILLQTHFVFLMPMDILVSVLLSLFQFLYHETDL